MLRIASVSLLAVLATALPAKDVRAQEAVFGGALLGGATGALIGGAAAGGRGAAVGAVIGAGTGAVIGAQMERRRGGYYWYQGRCWYRQPNGDYHRVSNRNCG
jgi:uncharacterized protein YcfJ